MAAAVALPGRFRWLLAGADYAEYKCEWLSVWVCIGVSVCASICVRMCVCVRCYAIKCALTLTVAYCAPCAVPALIIFMLQLSLCLSYNLLLSPSLSLSLTSFLSLSFSLWFQKKNLLILYIICMRYWWNWQHSNCGTLQSCSYLYRLPIKLNGILTLCQPKMHVSVFCMHFKWASKAESI